jgi:predicted GTPase
MAAEDLEAQARRVLILGAAGRDFHNFNVVFRSAPAYRVVAFTAAQIPDIEGRTYPPSLAGPLYPDGIEVLPQAQWEDAVRVRRVDEVVFAYSDVSHVDVMHIASRAVALGADFRLLGARATMLRSRLPVVSVCAVRTGCGKSAVARFVARVLREAGRRVAVIRHPMPYGDLALQAVQRFATLDDLAVAACSVEEREEYEPHIRAGDLVFAGVDYERVLRAAEAEAEVIVWDGGNNDLPFVEPDLEIVLVDPHRAGHETAYYPGEANLVRADVVVVPKVDTARPVDVERLEASVARANPRARLVRTALPLSLDRPELVRGRRVLVIEDGPTVTHGEMGSGAGLIAARRFEAAAVVDPRPYATGSIKQCFERYPWLGPVLPAMGYSVAQLHELEQTINAVPCDTVVVASPVDLRRLIAIDAPSVRVSYEVEETGEPLLSALVRDFLANPRERTGRT